MRKGLHDAGWRHKFCISWSGRLSKWHYWGPWELAFLSRGNSTPPDAYGELFIGDNSVVGEVWLLRNKLNPEMNVEEGLSNRAVLREYAKIARISFSEAPTSF